jgi:hypothetical protein
VFFKDFCPIFLKKSLKNSKKNSKNILFYNDLAQEFAQNKQQEKNVDLQILLITSKLHITIACEVCCFLLCRV